MNLDLPFFYPNSDNSTCGGHVVMYAGVQRNIWRSAHRWRRIKLAYNSTTPPPPPIYSESVSRECLEKNCTRCWFVRLKFAVWLGRPARSNPIVDGQAWPRPSTLSALTSAPGQSHTSSHAPGWTSLTLSGWGNWPGYAPLAQPLRSAHCRRHSRTSGSGPKLPSSGVRP